ncbi:DNA-binding MarR family transcriptional regulator/GNAT superfamily N-acetyltransferase [Sphingomonas sp. BE138]|uniref:bifunctional helix-turn-helix transcriptional regulator/GNAT family N-acetyltransferase n=1 Tax=Sphingomonas sp. BE138 TaxID=2817845 RepID=UPI0028603CEA|nr:helix-turn-helix domain-containing GNAT family N-acetyltransferase [Sphingomonas sp. BE138]MDR6787164.1 DNA-binding MarR family transcriptional regulator/GNAT superfamily N-acetyltransferase [Sphingomonas sp. BE138]
MEDADVTAVRRFNRFYTQTIGALDAHFLGTDASLLEARLLFEIATREPVTASVLQDVLGMDAGYLSRMIARFQARGWVVRVVRADDARARDLRLTETGRDAFAIIDERQRAAVSDLLDEVTGTSRRDLVEALTRARLLLDPASGGPFHIRPFRTGEPALIAARQSVLYAESHGWGRELEVIEGAVTAAFLRDFDPAREQCWVAEIDGVMAGAVFVTDEGDGLARLRLLHVEFFARRRGIGEALVARCVGFAREAGYTALTLWTHSVLQSARRIYAAQGFRCVEMAMHDRFGVPLQGETWRLELVA